MLCRFACAAFAVAVATTAFGQDLNQKVNAAFAAQPLGRLIPALGKQLGVDLRATHAVEGDVVMLDVQDVTLSNLLAKIAEVTNRAWESKDGHLTLIPSNEADRRAAQENLKRRAEIARAAIAKLVSSPRGKREWTAAEAESLANETETLMNPKDGHLDSSKMDLTGIGGRSPIVRAITALLANIPSEDLARTWSKQIAFATNPTSMQRALPFSAKAALDRYLQEQIMFVAATKEFKEKAGPKDTYFSMSGVPRGEFRTGNPKLGVGKAILRVSASEGSKFMMAVLTVTDAKGVVLDEGDLSVPLVPAKPTIFEPKKPEEALVPSPMILEMDKATHDEVTNRGSSSYATSTEKGTVKLQVPAPLPRRQNGLSPTLRATLLVPDKADPLSLTATPLLSEAAEGRRANLVVCLDDRVFAASLRALAKGTRPTTYLSSEELQGIHEVTESGGWLTIKPRDIEATRGGRVNREALAQLLGSVDRNKMLLLGDLCQFATEQESGLSMEKADYLYLQILNPAAAAGTYDGSKWYLYRLYGLLSPEQKRTWQNGGSLTAQTLSPSAQGALFNFVFGSYSGLKLTGTDGKEIEPYGAGIVTDWTELLQNGVLPGSTMAAQVAKEDAAYCLDSATGSAQIISADDLATSRFISETPGLRGSAMWYDRFAPATSWKMSLTFTLGAGIAIVTDLRDGVVDTSGNLRDFGNLPPAFLGQVNGKLGIYRESFGKWDFTGRGSATPPP